MAWRHSYTGRAIVQLIAGMMLLTVPSFAAQAASEARCREYAKSAVADYQQLRNIPKCSKLRPKDTVRWHPQFDTHFNWCRTVETGALNSETGKRDQLLLDCGGRSKL